MDQEDPYVEALYNELRRALRHGARAGQLLTYSTDLINLLCPPAQIPARGSRPSIVRALNAEDIVRKGIASIGGSAGSVLLIILGLKLGTLEQKLEERRQAAAPLLGIQPATFRRDHHEKQLLLNLAIEIYRLLSAEPGRVDALEPPREAP